MATPHPDSELRALAGRVRAFNRFYTRRIGVLDDRLLATEHTLAEARVLHELAHADGLSATELGRGLDLDAGYLSRLLRRLERRGLVRRRRSAADRRLSELALTRAGRRAFTMIDERATDATATLLQPLPPAERRDLVGAMETVERILGQRGVRETLREGADPAMPVGRLRIRRAGPRDAAAIARVLAAAFAPYRPSYTTVALRATTPPASVIRARLTEGPIWVAVRGAIVVGTVSAVPGDGELYVRSMAVAPSEQGAGIGRGLLETVEAEATVHGLQRLRLSTTPFLDAAIRLYETFGFRFNDDPPHELAGTPLRTMVRDVGRRQRRATFGDAERHHPDQRARRDSTGN